MQKLSLLILFTIITVLSACEDAIDLKVDQGQSYPVVDAWITDEATPQKIVLTQSVAYTTPGKAPVISDATVTLYDVTAGKTYAFAFQDNAYRYDAGAGQAIGVVNHVYKLAITYKGEIFEAYDTLKRVPPIDSITYEFKTKEESVSNKEGYYAKFHAKDLPNGMDYYWIRSYRNDLTQRLEDGFSVNGSYDEDIAIDGGKFILPIAENITDYLKPFQKDEKVIVRLLSLTKGTHQFLTQVNEQINAGGLFAKVLENVKSNLRNTEKDGKYRLLGWFATSGVSQSEKVVK